MHLWVAAKCSMKVLQKAPIGGCLIQYDSIEEGSYGWLLKAE